MKKTISNLLALLMVASIFLTSCGKTSKGDVSDVETPSNSQSENSKEDTVSKEVILTVAAAASLEYSFEEKLIPMFEKTNPSVKVKGVYDASGKLQTQIEEGLNADIFMSAASKQMNSLVEKDLVKADSVVDLLENKIVLIVPEKSEAGITSFEDITKAKSIAIGDPASVPVGQYSQEALTSLGIWETIQPKVSLGTNVTEVLNWVAEGSADVGIVYATDAATKDNVKIIAEAPEGSLKKKVIYPIGIVEKTEIEDIAKSFMEFLESEEALAIFEEYGFSPNK